MGQTQTTPSAVSPRLTKTQPLYASLSRTLPALSLQDYNSIFASLAETDGATTTYWKEDTLARFLEVPPKIGSLLFKSTSYLAALPTLENVPVPLDKEGLGVAVMVLTQRIPPEVLTSRELNRLLFNSFAEAPPRPPDELKEKIIEEGRKASNIYGPQISVITMTELILFFLSITTSNPLATAETSIATTAPSNRRAAVQIAKSILSGIQKYAKSPSDSIHYDAFRAFCERDAPYFFDPLVPLFQKFLFDQHKWGDVMTPRDGWVGTLQAERMSELMNLSTLAQLSMFIPKERRLGILVGLYSGSKDGFSMGMFESKVLKYPGPSIILVRGSKIEQGTSEDSEEVMFGAYISTPWKSSTKDNFGDKHSILFQLLPNHTIYPSASYHTQFAYFNPRVGFGFGCPPPQLPRRQSFTAQTIISHTSDPQVSLSLDSALEQAVFTHTPPGATFSSNIAQGEYGYKIMVDEVEVWGCGVDNARDEQKRAWEYERTEAERRQNVRVREDLASDRALLEMAGIIGGNRSGGSI